MQDGAFNQVLRLGITQSGYWESFMTPIGKVSVWIHLQFHCRGLKFRTNCWPGGSAQACDWSDATFLLAAMDDVPYRLPASLQRTYCIHHRLRVGLYDSERSNAVSYRVALPYWIKKWNVTTLRCVINPRAPAEWRFTLSPGEDTEEMSKHKQILSWFSDTPDDPFSLHSLMDCASKIGDHRPGDWFGPSQVAVLIRSVFMLVLCGI